MNEKLKVIVVGLGLIGGSIAKSLKQNTQHTVLGINRSEGPLLDALSCGAIDGKAGIEDIKTADIVYLCTYPDSILQFVREHAPLFKKDCILTDACGIKTELCAGMEELKDKGEFVFVAGHPMAGKELSGFAASDPAMFAGASYIIAPCGAPDWAVKTVSDLALTMGFGRIVMTDPEQHDRVIAFTSQTPHVLACAYVMSPRCREHKGFSAGSYRDVSRVANINSKLWSGLFLDNKKALVSELDELQKNIGIFRDAIESGDGEKLTALLDEAARIKREEG